MTGKLIKAGTELVKDGAEEVFDLGSGLLGKGEVMPFEEAVKPKPKTDDVWDLEDFLDESEEATFMTREERADEFGVPGFHSSGADNIFTDGNPGFELGSHIGSQADQAEARYLTKLASGDIADQSGTTYAVRVDIKNPVEIVDDGGQHTATGIADALIDDQIIDVDEYVAITDAVNWESGTDKPDDTAAWGLIRDALEKRSFDGIEYVNLVEGSPAPSYIPLRENQVKSEFAAFGDPDEAARQGIPPWLAGVAGASAVLAAGGAPQQAEAADEWDTTDLTDSVDAETKDLAASEFARGAINQYVRGASFGASNEIVAAGRAVLDKVFDSMIDDPFADDADIIKPDESWWEGMGKSYDMYFADEKLAREEFQDAAPLTATALEVVGSLATGGASAVAAAKLIPGASIAMTGAATGLVDGAVYGFLDNDGELSDRARDALIFGAGGLVLGGAAGKGMEKGGQVYRDYVAKKHSQLLADDGITSTVAGRAKELGTKMGGKIKSSRPYRIVSGADKFEKEALTVVSAFQDDLIIARAKFPEAEVGTVVEIAAKRLGIEAPTIFQYAEQLGMKIRVPSVTSAARSAGRLEQARVQGFRNNSILDIAKRNAKDPGRTAVRWFQKTHDRIAKVSKPLALRMRQMEMENAKDVAVSMKHLGSLDKVYKKLSAAGARQFKKELLNNNRANAIAILRQVDPNAAATMQNVFKDIDKIGNDLKNVGYDIDWNPTYWPREVTDYDGLKAQMGEKQMNELDRLIKDAEAKGGKRLSAQERGGMISAYLRRYGNNFDGRAPNTKARTVDQIGDEMLDYYGDPLASLQRYIHIAHSDINMKKMFDRSAAGGQLSNFLKKRDIDPAGANEIMDNAITHMVDKAGLIEKLDFNEMDEFKSLFASRFGPGRKAMDNKMSQIKAMGHIEALGNFMSTATQIGDFANGAILNGGAVTAKTLVNQLLRRNKLDAKDMGLVHTVDVSTSGAGNSGLARMADMQNNLRWVLSKTGFTNMDGIAKNNLLNGALMRGEKLAKSDAGRDALRKRWGEAYGDQVENLIDDLAAGKVTENTKLFAFNTLSDAQPISLTEMPQSYLDMPNGRIIYTLKTFAVNQLNVLKNTISDPAAPKKTKMEAAAGLSKFIAYYGVINGSVSELKDAMRGGEFKLEDIPDNIIDSMLELGFLGRYSLDNYVSEGDIGGWAANTLMPVIPKTGNAGVTQIPVVGKSIDDWFLGGAEKRAKREAGSTKKDDEVWGDFDDNFGGDFGEW